MNFVFVLPLVYTVAGYFPAQPSNPCKVYLRFFAYSLVEFVNLEIFLIVILPLFFDPTTSIMTQFALKFIAQSVLGLAMLEAAWQQSRWLSKDVAVDSHDATILLVAAQASFSMYRHLIQESASTVGESVQFEVSGTLWELFLADQLLRGRTPVKDNVEFSKGVLRTLSGKVAPAEQVTEGEKEEDILEELRRLFCTSALVVMSFTEANSIVVTSLYYILMNVSTGSPGSGAIPLWPNLANLCIMLIGELVVIDGVIAYCARNFSRFTIRRASGQTSK